MAEKVIIGASGHGKVVADIIQKSGDKVFEFLDDNPKLVGLFEGFSVLGNVDTYKKYLNNLDIKFIVAIGNATIREKIVQKMEEVNWYTAIHPSAIVSIIDVKINKGTVVMANAVINPGTRIGRHCIINTASVVEHDNRIEDFVHVSVGAKLAGNVHLGKRTWVGIGATVSNNLTICSDCIIGAGGVVVKNIDKPGIYIGVPVKKYNLKN